MHFFLSVGAISGFLAVLLGAFGAHGLKQYLDEYSLKVFHTGVEYHFYHTFALLIVGYLLTQREVVYWKYSGYAFLVGIGIFSGSLYLLAVTRIKILGAITPIGGVSFMVGWILLAWGSWKTQ